MFGWTVHDDALPDGAAHVVFRCGEHAAGGMLALPAEGPPAHWLPYVAAADLDAVVGAIAPAGGRVLRAATALPGYGRFAVASDPHGAAFAAFQPAT